MRRKRVEKRSVDVGDNFATKHHGLVEVIEYVDSGDCKVRFEDGTVVKSRPYEVKMGKVKNPNKPKKGSVGFIGEGCEKSSDGGKNTYAYTKWTSMLKRCYGNVSYLKNRFYEDCYVCDEWHNFQNFSKWIKSQKGYGNTGWHLDKDLLVKGNTLYSAETCVLVPREVNLFLLRREAYRGEFPIGVTYHKTKGSFLALLSDGHGQHVLGTFNNPIDAFVCYKAAKEDTAKKLAEKYAGIVEEKVVKALLEFSVDIDD